MGSTCRVRNEPCIVATQHHYCPNRGRGKPLRPFPSGICPAPHGVPTSPTAAGGGEVKSSPPTPHPPPSPALPPHYHYHYRLCSVTNVTKITSSCVFCCR